MNNSFEMILKQNDIKKKFWFRVGLDVVWLFILCLTATAYIILADSSGYYWIVILFFFIFLFIEFCSSWRNEKYLITRIKVDDQENSIHIVVNKFDNLNFDNTYSLSTITAELKELRFGRLFVPNYMIIFRHNGKVILKQRENLVWKRTKIKKLAEILRANNRKP